MKPVALLLIACFMVASAQASPPVLKVDGAPFFPIGWYDSRQFNSAAAWTAGYAPFASQGMNTVLYCYGNWLNPSTNLTALDAAAANGLKMMVEVHRYAVQEQPGYPLSLIDAEVDAMKSHPALLGYYLMDEPELQGVSVSMLQDRYAQIKAIDPDHPIFVVHAHSGSYLDDEPPPYTDVFMQDTYVVLQGTAEFANPMWVVAQHARISTQKLEVASVSKQAYINVVQAHSADGSHGVRSPTFAEQRYLSYAPIVQGARGLMYWMHYYTTEDYRENVIAPIATEIESLVPAIISNSTAVSASSNRDGQSTHGLIDDISYLFGNDETGGYLIAVNNTAHSLSTEFTLHANALDALVEVVFESRSVVVNNLGGGVWQFNDTFSPYDVNVYRVFTNQEPISGMLLSDNFESHTRGHPLTGKVAPTGQTWQYFDVGGGAPSHTIGANPYHSGQVVRSAGGDFSGNFIQFVEVNDSVPSATLQWDVLIEGEIHRDLELIMVLRDSSSNKELRFMAYPDAFGTLWRVFDTDSVGPTWSATSGGPDQATSARFTFTFDVSAKTGTLNWQTLTGDEVNHPFSGFVTVSWTDVFHPDEIRIIEASLHGNAFGGWDNISLFAVPEPASLALIGMGALLMFRRRLR